MSTWSAINVEAEDETVAEIDDTKEIQLEEAFKLYQNALRLHSLGPAHQEEAHQAYDELFKSEVFKYPEALSEFEHDQLDTISPLALATQDLGIIPALSGTATDNANSFPQLVYLAYKSRAQFEIDSVHCLYARRSGLVQSELGKLYYKACKQSLVHAAAALERDDTDIDLWKRAARVADVLQSARVVRFCLESVLAGDEEGQDTIDLSGLDEAFAKGELQDILSILQDDLGGARVTELRPRSSLLILLKQTNDPYPYLPARPKSLADVDRSRRPQNLHPKHVTLSLDTPSHVGLAKAFSAYLTSIADDAAQLAAALAVKLELPRTHGHNIVLDGQDSMMGNNPRNQVVDSTVISSDAEGESPASFHSVLENSDNIKASPLPEEMEQPPATEQSADATATMPQSGEVMEPSQMLALPSRKRSSTAAGNEEPESRTKSRRIRARESLVVAPSQEEEVSLDRLSVTRPQFQNIKEADYIMFGTVQAILAKVGLDGMSQSTSNETTENRNLNNDDACSIVVERMLESREDLKHALQTWSEESTAAFMSGHTARDHVEKSTGLALFQKHTKTESKKEHAKSIMDSPAMIQQFIRHVNGAEINAQQVLFLWLRTLLTKSSGKADVSLYMEGVWPPYLKSAVNTIIVSAHEAIEKCFIQSVSSTLFHHPETGLAARQVAMQLAEFAETMFELHLEIYADMTTPESTIEAAGRSMQLGRLRKWGEAASAMVRKLYYEVGGKSVHTEPLALRFMWTSISFTRISDSAEKRHVLSCLRDLRELLGKENVNEIILPNNNVMPKLSSDAVEQEISRLKTLEFFLSVFDTDGADPEAVILKLEPILEYDQLDSSSLSTDEREQVEEFRSFLAHGDASLRLFLWKKLQNAYTAISYNTKVVSCLLRSIETICGELVSLRETFSDPLERQMSVLRWLRDIDDLVTKVLGKIADDKTAFEAIDESHLRSSMAAIVSCIHLVHIFIEIDDQFRVGDLAAPTFRTATAVKNFEKCRDRFRELHVRLWVLLYWMLKEATAQLSDSFENPAADLILFLRHVHGALGERELCKFCNKLFVRTAKTELFALQDAGDVSADIAQILYDTYQIKLLNGYGDAEHGCPPESLDKDKKTAQNLVPIVMEYVRRLNIKDLLRSELRNTIDKIQGALGQPKPSTAVSFNRRAISGYLKSVVHPQRLYQCLRGIGDIETKPVHGDVAEIASTGWYLLLGKMTLAKYRSVKRVNPTPTDDLDNAMAYLRQDLEHDASNWESWYRLAQVLDAKIEDNLIWNANKLNDGRAELATSERNAINAYTMASALAMRNAEDDLLTTKVMNDMFFEFAVRLYSSSRPPLDMEAFSTKKAVRHLSNYYSQAMSEEPLFKPITEYRVWNLAAHLIKRSLESDSSNWYKYYMLGKCLWKMFNNPQTSSSKARVDLEDVLEAFTEAVIHVPKKEKSSDPILEPHFKLVSIVHKLQDRLLITSDKAVEYLQATQYAKGVQPSYDDQGRMDWEAYILVVLKKLQTADKSGWHHRITSRAAHVMYDKVRDLGGALGAKHKFTESIFTKNMTMQVWKPEHERAGRHYVYTGRYLRFFVEILEKLRDRSNLEQVVRKIRRKTTDFINHTKIWEDAVTVYVDLLRSIPTPSIPRGKERALFDNISFDEFSKQSEKLEQWAHDATTTTTNLDIIKDAIEMKKLNNSLMKSSAIDDLIGDAYACMYEEFISQLPAEDQVPHAPQSALPQGTFINMTTDTAPTGDDSLDRMRLNNLLSGNTDGPGASAQDSPLPIGLGVASTGLPLVGTPPPDMLKVPGPAKPGRAKTITRREVQRKAEAAVGKPPPIKTPTLTKRSISVNIPSIRRDMSGAGIDEDDDGEQKEFSHDASRVTSSRGSVSMRDSPVADGDGAEDEGSEGDNEDEDEEDNDAEDTDDGVENSTRKRPFSSLSGPHSKDEDNEDESGDERTSDAPDKNEDDGQEDEPDATAADGAVRGEDDMDTD